MALLDRFERFLDQVLPPPDEVAAGVRRGVALLAAGDAQAALRAAESALLVAPGYLRATVLKVDALVAAGAPHDALVVLDEASTVRALPADVLARMVELAARVGDTRRALDLEARVRTRLRGSDPAVARRLVAAARSLLARGEVAAGLRLARGATQVDPSAGAAWLLLGHDALARGDALLARRALERGTGALDPADGEMNRLAGEIALGLGDTTGAARLLRRAWIVGDEAALAPLVGVLLGGGQAEALERVLADAQGELGSSARAVVALARHQHRAQEALATVSAPGIPDALWPFALDVALRFAPSLAERWAREAPSRPGAPAVLALAAAREELEAGRRAGAREAAAPALRDGRTREAARTLLSQAWTSAWSGRLGALLEEMAVLVREAAEGRTLEAALRARRRELDEPLRVALLGEFSAGKSTFLNALVGTEVSPMGVLPTTAQVHWLRHGDPGARIVDLRGGVVEASIEEAPRVVARKRALGEVIDYVEVMLPIARLERIEVIDTPGFNAGEPAHEEAVRRAFELADVGIWLFDTRQAGKQSEVGPLTEARDHGLPVVGVLNKIDQVAPEGRDTLLAFLQEGFGQLAPCVRAVSARQAFEAARAATPGEAADLLARSGWADLLRFLDERLITRRIAWKQARVAARSRLLLDEAWVALEQQGMRARQRTLERDALEEAIAALREQLPAVAQALRRHVDAVLREQLRGLHAEGKDPDVQALVADAVAEIGFRARARALEDLGARVHEVERLAIAAGVVPEHAASLLSAPVVAYLDQAVAEGVRDASSALGAAAGPSFVPSDPLAALDGVVDRLAWTVDGPSDVLGLALDVARTVLAGFEAPAIVSGEG